LSKKIELNTEATQKGISDINNNNNNNQLTTTNDKRQATTKTTQENITHGQNTVRRCHLWNSCWHAPGTRRPKGV